jgi:hypothetical protein
LNVLQVPEKQLARRQRAVAALFSAVFHALLVVSACIMAAKVMAVMFRAGA